MRGYCTYPQIGRGGVPSHLCLPLVTPIPPTSYAFSPIHPKRAILGLCRWVLSFAFSHLPLISSQLGASFRHRMVVQSFFVFLGCSLVFHRWRSKTKRHLFVAFAPSFICTIPSPKASPPSHHKTSHPTKTTQDKPSKPQKPPNCPLYYAYARALA